MSVLAQCVVNKIYKVGVIQNGLGFSRFFDFSSINQEVPI